MGFSLANAFDLGRVQRIDLASALMLALLAHPPRQRQFVGEEGLKRLLAPDLAADVADDPAEIGADRPERPVGALELLGVGVALMLDQRIFADALVGLAQREAVLLGQPDQPLARPMHQLGVGRERHRLGLNGGVDNDLGEIGRFGRAAAGGDVQALLDQGDEHLLAHARWRQRVIDERSNTSACRNNSSPQNG